MAKFSLIHRVFHQPFILPSWAANLQPWIENMVANSSCLESNLPWEFKSPDGTRRLIMRHPDQPDKLLVYHEKRSVPIAVHRTAEHAEVGHYCNYIHLLRENLK